MVVAITIMVVSSKTQRSSLYCDLRLRKAKATDAKHIVFAMCKYCSVKSVMLRNACQMVVA